MHKNALVCAIFLPLVMGCSAVSDPTEASEKNFREVLSTVRPEGSCLVLNQLGGRDDIEQTHSVDLRGNAPIYDELVRTGYMELISGPGSIGKIYGVVANKNSMTNRFERKNWLGEARYAVGFCPGTYSIDDIKFTIPSNGESGGKTIVDVSWRVDDVPEDFTNFQNFNTYYDVGSQTISPLSVSGNSKFLLQLTNKGWEVQNEIRNQ